ncbi:hypothetical protein Cgig2_017590 [Carnegiea gigantea]|uniref:Uncharacterized protein n=1 Tax=Carnegiea gigantea TaxID=171969 RepID=A0A9Q1KNL7_9CARY|nr:hypothetical protein Cgig2_017590 [Carnegiea gigantea]
MEEDNLTSGLRSQITSLQNRIKELEIENANLASQIAQCRCAKVEGQDNTKAIANSGVLVEETELLKDGVRKTRKKRSNDRDSKKLHHLPKRYIALKVMYFGQRYYGFASDAQMEPTVEDPLFAQNITFSIPMYLGHLEISARFLFNTKYAPPM